MSELSAGKPWRDVSEEFSGNEDAWVISDGRKIIKYQSSAHAVNYLKNWHPYRKVLVARPNSKELLPPICIDEIAQILLNRFRKKAIIGVVVYAVFCAFSFGLMMNHPDRFTGAIFGFSFFLAIAFAVDNLIIQGSVRGIRERAQFIYWLRTDSVPRTGMMICVGFLAAIAIIQFVLEEKLGGLEPLVREYGFFYARLKWPEVWRVITGPLWHGSVAHFSNNAVMLVFIGPIAWSLVGMQSIFAFLLGNAAGAFLQMYLGSPHFDSYLGISAGIFSLFGLVVGSFFRKPHALPVGFRILCVWIALGTIVISELLSAKAASIAHISGLVVGLILSCIIRV